MIVIGSKREYERVFKNASLDQETLDAIEAYVSNGGVIKLESVNPLKIVYPSKARLKQQLEEARNRKKKLDSEIRSLSRKKEGNAAKKVKVLLDPVYWKHRIKLVSDSEYRKAYETVEMPIEAASDAKHRRMVEMFVNNPEYRERLVEARTSLIGRSRGSIRETVEKNSRFRNDVIVTRISKLKKERAQAEQQEKVLSRLLHFSSRIV